MTAHNTAFPADTLADYKTLNYLYYEQARRFARDHGADEAIILNPDNTVSEINTAGLFAIEGKRLTIPESDHELASVALKSVQEILSGRGYNICRKKYL